MKRKSIYNSKKGLSTVVTTLLILGVSIIAVGLVWASATKMIKGQIGNSEACYDISNKVQLNSINTCYEEEDGQYNLRFQVEVKGVNISGLVVSVNYGGESKGYKLTQENQTIEGLIRYPITVPAKEVKVPGADQGFSYIAGEFDSKVDSIEISPIMGEVQCERTDYISEIDNCALMVE